MSIAFSHNSCLALILYYIINENTYRKKSEIPKIHCYKKSHYRHFYFLSCQILKFNNFHNLLRTLKAYCYNILLFSLYMCCRP